MSLVNDTLRDLDARRGSGSRTPDLYQPTPVPVRRQGRLLVVGAGAALLVTVSAVVYRWLVQPESVPLVEASVAAQSVQQPQAAQDDVTRVEVKSVAVSAITETPVKAAAENIAANADKMSANQSSIAHLDALQRLLTAADQALADNRLTQPPVDNAFALYSHVLLLEPGNKQALRGITRIQARYEKLIRDAARHHQWQSAAQYLQRARTVAMPSERLTSLEALVARAKAAASTASGDTAEKSRAPVEVAEAVEPEVDQPDARDVSIELSWRSRETSALVQADRLVRQGRQVAAMETLQEVVAQYPQAESAALELFDLYLQTGRNDQARALQMQTQNRHLRRYYEARFLTSGGDKTAALKLLEQSEPVGVVRQPSLALQAALYQQSGQHQQALRLYQRLVELNNRQPNYWLGLGVAAEAVGHTAQALRAFVAANQLRPTNPAVSNYLNQRIETLSR